MEFIVIAKYTTNKIGDADISIGIGTNKNNGIGFDSRDNYVDFNTKICVSSNSDNGMGFDMEVSARDNLKKKIVCLGA